MYDLYKEIQIPRKPAGKDKFLVTLLGALTVICIVFGLLFHFVGLVLAIVLGFFTWLRKGYLHMEYEYTYTNGQLKIDRILDARRRKRIVTFSPEKLLCLAPKGSTALEKYPPTIKTTDYTRGDGSEPYYVAVYQTDKGQLAVWLELPDDVVRSMQMVNPRAVFTN